MLYENQYIGNFNYQLGYYLGKNNYLKPFSINTYQQTFRHDKTVGDMFGNLGGKYFILEFKRSKKDYVAELNKEHRIKLLTQLQANPVFGLLSRKGHFLCHSEELTMCHIKLKKEYVHSEYEFCPYVELITGVSGIASNSAPIINGMDEFTLNIAFDEVHEGKHAIGMNYDELKKYLGMMKECAGESDYETTGTVSCFNSESNSLISINFESLHELDKQLNLNLDHFHELGNHFKTTLDKPKLPPSKKDRGLSL